MVTLTIRGLIKEEETGIPLAGLYVKAYDKDLLFDDLLGTAIADEGGRFVILSEPEDFRDLFEKRPDLYFKVFSSDQKTLIHSTESAVVWNVGVKTEVEIRVPGKKSFPPEKAKLQLTGADGTAREAFEGGDSLVFSAVGLRPITTYEIRLSSEGRELFASRLISNRRGAIDPTVLWPQIGLEDPGTEARFTFEEAHQRWAGKAIEIAVLRGRETVLKQAIRLTPIFQSPLLFSADREGRPLNGFEAGKRPLMIAAHNIPFSGDARLYVVPRQHDWRAGDEFLPVYVHDLAFEARQRSTILEVAPSDSLPPGAYDFILRPIRYGYEEDEILHLRPSDIVGGRLTTGVVIREGFWLAKPVLGGCVNKVDVSGRSVSGAPYFRYGDTFEIGEDVWAALDPGIVDPGNISKMCAFYVVAEKTTAQWDVDNSLNHLPALGGNAAVIKRQVQSGCINANKVLVWPGAMTPGEYDIVADFGQNTPDPLAFAPDNAYNTPLDIIDGYFTPGFRVVEDPGSLIEFANAGTFSYDETVVTGMGMVGTPTVQDEATQYGIPGAFSTINTPVPLRAQVYFPADMPGATSANQVSAARPDYPVVVIVHGNGHSYTSYAFLLEHFAKNGFIAASIHLVSNMRGLGRANVLFLHLAVLNAMFGTKVQNNIGIMGHSRGGEAVVKAVRLNQQNTLGHNFNAVISLGPTDQYGKESFGGAWAKPYFVLYGAHDRDISGDWWTSNYTLPQTGFALWDRASGMKKTMVFVYGATHNGFITANDASPEPGDLLVAPQKDISKAYMNAFFRWHLRGESKWEGMFQGEWKARAVELSGVNLFVQYQDTNRRDVDAFDGAHSPVSWQTSTIGGTVSHAATLPADPQENELHSIDDHAPHDTGGLRLRWDNSGDLLEFAIPMGQRDVRAFRALSFRASQVFGSVHNPANQDQNFRVLLKDGSGNQRAVRVSPFGRIPTPDPRTYPPYDLTHPTLEKSALATIRIPLRSYNIVCAGQPKVDLADVISVAFQFSEKSTGEINIDNLEFTN